MLHAIDFDGTFSRDTDYYREVVAIGRRRGHEYVLVTGRSDELVTPGGTTRWGDEVRRDVGDLMPIVFAGSKWKRQAALDAGFRVDVWTDDNPEYVGPQSPLTAAHKGVGGSYL